MAQAQNEQQAQEVERALVQIDERWNELRQELNRIPGQEKTTPNAVGTWSVKDVMGHIAVWDDVAARRIELAVGRPDVAIEEMPWHERNEREAAKRAGWSLAEVEAELDQAHEKLMSAVRSLARAEPAVAAERIAELPDDTSDHYAEHLEQIRAWRERSSS